MGFSLDEEEKSALLASPLFRPMSPSDQETLLKSAVPLHFAPRDVILHEGDEGQALYYLLQGQVQVSATSPQEKKPVVLGTLNSGAFFGEVALFNQHQRTATVTATKKCQVICFYMTSLEPWLLKYPEIRRMLETIVKGRAEHTITKLVTGST